MAVRSALIDHYRGRPADLPDGVRKVDAISEKPEGAAQLLTGGLLSRSTPPPVSWGKGAAAAITNRALRLSQGTIKLLCGVPLRTVQTPYCPTGRASGLLRVA